MMGERGVVISHSTIRRWVQRYVPEFERRWSRYARGVHPSWRMDETAVSVRGGARYLSASQISPVPCRRQVRQNRRFSAACGSQRAFGPKVLYQGLKDPSPTVAD